MIDDLTCLPSETPVIPRSLLYYRCYGCYGSYGYRLCRYWQMFALRCSSQAIACCSATSPLLRSSAHQLCLLTFGEGKVWRIWCLNGA